MKKSTNLGKISLCIAVAAATMAFTGCTKYKLVAVEDSVADSVTGSSTAAASSSGAQSTTGGLPTSDKLATEALPETETAAQTESTAEAASSSTAADDGKLQIVVLGDSIFDNYRTPSGIASLVASDLNANVYNMAVAGTPAGLPLDCPNNFDKFNISNFIGVAHVLTGDIDPSLLKGENAEKVYGTFDPAKTDYFIVEYGINDFLSSIPRESDMSSRELQMYSYRGGLQNGIEALQGKFPDAQIILMAPGYTQFWNNGSMIGDCNTVDRGFGRLIDYTSTAVNLAQQMNIPYINSYEDVDINGYSASDCLQDGIHPTDEGCRRYAAAIETKIKELEDAKNGTTETSSASESK